MGRGLTKLAEISLFIGGFLVLWYVTGEKIFRRKKKIVKENILLILRHLCLDIYKVLNETSKTTKSVYDMIKNEPNTSIELNKLEEVLLNNGYKQRIEEVEKEVLNKFDVTVEDFYEELKNYEKDEDVQKVLNSIKKMYHESLLGIQPKLPSINENITQDVILNLTSLIYKKKRKIYKEKIDSMIKKNQDFNLNTTFSNSEFFNKLQKSTEHVEEQVIKENQDLVPNLFTFKYLVNYYSDDINFVQRKKYLESKHGEKMIKILKVKKIKKKKKISKDSLSNNSVKSAASQNELTDHTSSEKNYLVTPPIKQDDIDNNNVMYHAGSDISAGNKQDGTSPYVEVTPPDHHVEELYMGQNLDDQQDDQQVEQQDKFEPTAPLEEHMVDFVQSTHNIEEVQDHKVEEVEEEVEEEDNLDVEDDEEEEAKALLGVIAPSDGEMSQEDSPLSVQTDGGHANEEEEEEGDGWIQGDVGHDEGDHLHEYHTKIEDYPEEDNAEEGNVEEDNAEQDNAEEGNVEEGNAEEDNVDDEVGLPDEGSHTEEPAQIMQIDQEVNPYLNVQPEGEDDWASAMSQGVDPSVQLEEKEGSHVQEMQQESLLDKTEEDNLEAEKSATEEGGVINEELPQEENELTNGEADGGKAEDEPLPQEEDEAVAVEMVEPVEEELPTEELPSEEVPQVEPPTEEPATEEIPTEEPTKEEIPTEDSPKEELGEEPAKEEIPTEEPVKEEVPTEEQPQVESPSEEPTKDNLPTEEQPQVEPPTEEAAKEDPPKEDPSKEEPPKEEPPKEEPPKEERTEKRGFGLGKPWKRKKNKDKDKEAKEK
ncbi:Uncharacterized protein PCOAH_00052890 [Plasmodium coatneyi]|uniref:Uncharacterized protein n=1 Tax=Plasmodium coatneyi TaxID=208452 RepID=A0A1B1E7E2_9APIC|nr:Uncharacterized protein PCOAH_00052890 [Plasmodium coatneyi]ANQ10952.1 Uncharacterized protein PCOAH_00052890 [Plasmodium coatneyi]